MRAHERIGQTYNLVSANCEHFVTEVRTGRAVSLQVETAGQWAIVAAIGVGIAVMAAIVFGVTRKRNRNSK